MEITRNIKAKVFAQYLGQKHSGSIHTLAKEIEMIYGDEKFDRNIIKLILKPLSSITDEDAIEMAELFGGIKGDVTINRPTDLTNNDIHFTVQIHQGEKNTWKSFSVPKHIDEHTPNGYCQFLMSKGYDLHQYLLGGKTLKEADLAIYE